MHRKTILTKVNSKLSPADIKDAQTRKTGHRQRYQKF